MILLLSCSLGAVELPRPDAPPEPAVEPAAEPDAPEARAEAAVQADADAPAPEAMPGAKPEAEAGEAYLGIGGTEMPELLSTHLGLKAGEGVVVRTIDPEGPAAANGVQENDVVLRVAGVGVGSQDELRDAVLDHKPGDDVELDLIHEGKPVKKTVKLAGRPPLPGAAGLQLDPRIEGLPEGQAKRVREAIEQNLRALEGLQAPELQPVPEAMKQLEKRMELMFRGLGGAAGEGGGIQMHGSSSVRLHDGQGSVEMQSKDGSKQMRVRDNDGKVEWEGPWDTEQDKAAAPDGIRQRIERLDLDVIEDGGNGGLRLQLRPGIGGLEVEPQMEEERE